MQKAENNVLKEALHLHISKFIPVSDQDYAQIRSFFKVMSVAKKENLLIEGKVCKFNYFVSHGCIRLFFNNEKGTEQTTQFALENWWLSDYNSFSSQIPSEFNIQAVETSEIFALGFDEQEELLQKFPLMEKYFRLVHQKAHAASQFRIKVLYDLSREKLYHQFAKRYPDFVQRVPQYLLASFLGFTPEYLSEIRNKRRS